jgi:hypothetical protein
MSLVVAEATDEGPRIVSDTRVRYPGLPLGYKTGTLKTVVLRDDIAVSFVGDVEAGLGAIRQIADDLKDDGGPDGVLSTLLERTARAPEAADFIVAVDGQDWQLTRISSGQLERGLNSAWIGDQWAFERFQRVRHASPEPFREVLEKGLGTGSRVILRLGDAMQAVIGDPTVETVDQFCVRVARQHDGFQYLASVFIYVERDFEIQQGDDLVDKMAQPVEEGGYAVAIVEPAKPGTPALGLSFPRARLGMVFLPLLYDQAQVIRDVSANDLYEGRGATRVPGSCVPPAAQGQLPRTRTRRSSRGPHSP